MTLQAILQQHNVSQAWLAEQVGVSAATINLIVKYQQFPTKPKRAVLVEAITAALKTKGIEALENLFPSKTLEIDMLLRKQQLSPEARKAFGLFKDPFANDVQAPDDVFVTPDSRYVRESLFATVKFGGFMAIVGESGSGKTTLKRDLLDRIRRETMPIIIVEPYVLGMEDNDQKGKTMKAAGIADAIIRAIAPLEKPRVNMQAKSEQLHKLLKESSRSGNTIALCIEEAHALSIPTLKHLKRFYELEDGFKKLLSIVLIGQTELKTKLSESAPEIREVVQRCELVELTSLDGKTEDYLRFKFGRVGKELSEVFEPDAINRLRERLTFTQKSKTSKTVSITYPLMLNNVVITALNMTAKMGFSKVSSDIINEI